METKGLKLEELEAQEFGLLPDRVEMRRRRRRGIRNTAIAVNENTNVLVNINESFNEFGGFFN